LIFIIQILTDLVKRQEASLAFSIAVTNN